MSAIAQNRLGSDASNFDSTANKSKDTGQSTFLVKKEMMLEHIEEASSAKDEFSRTASMLVSQVTEKEEQEDQYA